MVRTGVLSLVLLGQLTLAGGHAHADPLPTEDGTRLSAPPPPVPEPPPEYVEASGKPGPWEPPLGPPDAAEPEPAPLSDLRPEQRSHAAIGYEVLGGTAGFATGLFPLLTDSPDAIVVVMPFTVALGVWIAGAVSGGDGDFGAVILGELVGALFAAPFTLAGLMCTSDCALGLTLGLAAGLVFPIGGAVIGYEMSNEVPPLGTE